MYKQRARIERLTRRLTRAMETFKDKLDISGSELLRLAFEAGWVNAVGYPKSSAARAEMRAAFAKWLDEVKS